MKHKKKFGWRDPAKTTGRDNPKGGGSPALMRAKSVCAAMEARAASRGVGLPTHTQKAALMSFAMSVAEEMKHNQ